MTPRITQPTGAARSRVLHPHPGHSKANCLKILRRLSAFIDDELPTDVCKEVRKHLGACPNCELFVGSLQQTIGLCRHAEPRPLSSRLRSRIRRHVLNSVGRY